MSYGTKVSPLDVLALYAMAFVGREYIYGGNGPYFDCSGYVITLLNAARIGPPHDMTAQELFNYYKPLSQWDQHEKGALAFYGKSENSISHVAWMITKNQVLEAGGGNSTTVSVEEARKRGAFVRMRPLSATEGKSGRKDLVATLLPSYDYEQ